MSYKALYRTYRPATFEQVAGQKHIVRTLSNALKENKIAHAYLFCGPRGTGKTTMARLFAKSLNCEQGFGCQCNMCANCKAIIEGSHPDVIEIDAASNRGIDDVRDLISKVKYAPSLGKYKVYIIDEVHMMTTEAFNALLKTLEEPPSNVIFILCTTEPYKLMATILSRVQRYDFNKVSDQDIFNNLKMICGKENIEVEDEALNLIVSLSDGGVRDSLSLLDQAIAYSGKKLELHHVQELYGLTTLEEKIKLIKAINDQDVKYFTTSLDSLIGHGTDIKRLTLDLIDIVKDFLIYDTTKDASILKMLNIALVTTIKISHENLIMMLDELMNVYAQYRYVSNVNDLLEVAFLKMSNKCIQKKVEEKVVVQPAPVSKEQVKVEPIKQEDVKPQQEALKPQIKEVKGICDSGTAYELSEDDTINLMQQANKIERIFVEEKWDLLKDYLTSDEYGTYASCLRQCTPKIVAQDVLVLETGLNNVAKKISYIENQNKLSSLIELITGKKYQVVVLHIQESVRRVQKFANLRTANKLPEKYPINIKVI